MAASAMFMVMSQNLHSCPVKRQRAKAHAQAAKRRAITAHLRRGYYKPEHQYLSANLANVGEKRHQSNRRRAAAKRQLSARDALGTWHCE